MSDTNEKTAAQDTEAVQQAGGTATATQAATASDAGGQARPAGLLKFITCGSVDDGKSTLIGHMLYDSKLIFADQEQALILDSKTGSRGGAIDYSLLLDGLAAEREQGITIDVAYRYFTTSKRSFIVADTPGHEEYTRNMAVGASFAELAVILLDATKGVLVQTRRHARICALMGIRHFVFAVNKMDLAGYEKATFDKIEAEIRDLADELGLEDVAVIPISATEGDNVTHGSANMPWYTGKPVLTYLEEVNVDDEGHEQGFYLPVQRVCRPNHTFRGFEGQVESGTVSVGDELTVLPSGQRAHVKKVLVGDRDEQSATIGQPVTVQLDREVDVSRGCMLERGSGLVVANTLDADILWMDDEPLAEGHDYLVKIGTSTVPGVVERIDYEVDVNTGEHRPAHTLAKNGLARATVSLVTPVPTARFDDHRTAGEFILIDRVSNMTSACGVVRSAESAAGAASTYVVTPWSRARQKGQHAVVVGFAEGDAAVDKVESRLALAGRHTFAFDAAATGAATVEVAKALHDAGVVALVAADADVLAKLATELPKGTYTTVAELVGDARDDVAAVADAIAGISKVEASFDAEYAPSLI